MYSIYRLSSAPLGTCESSDKLSSGKIDHTRLTQVDWNVDLRDRHKMLDSATSSSLPILLSPIVAFAALLALQRFREAATVYWLLVGYPSSAFSVSNALHRLKSDLSQISDERSDRIGENSIGSDANKEDLDDKILNREGFQSKDTLMIVRIVAAVSGKEQSEFCVQLLARVLKNVSVKQN